MPILSSKRWVDRRQRNFRWRAHGIGGEIISQEKQCSSHKQTAGAGYYGLGTQVFLIALGSGGLARWCRAEREKNREKQGRRAHSPGRFRRRHGAVDAIQNSKKFSPIFIGRWTPKILFSLKGRPHRHGQLRRQLGSVSQRMLTRTLRNLESAGLVARRVTGSKTVAVEYSLTRRGRTILTPLRGMCRWAKRHRRFVSAEVHLPEAHKAE